MEVIELQTVVVGAGVVGLAVGRKLASLGKEVWVLEREETFGTQTSSRNSEVIHAGLYYPKNSLKARLCVEGRLALYRYCHDNNIPYKKTGKLVVACSETQRVKLQEIYSHALDNGCVELQCLDQVQTLALEPQVKAIASLYSPETGVIDSHSYMLQLVADIEGFGGQCVYHSEVSYLRFKNGVHELLLNQGEALIRAKEVVNACGLHAVSWINNVAGNKKDWPEANFASGTYFSYSGTTPFDHLIYPVPENGGLGIHLTLDLNGDAKFGPDVNWLDRTQIQDSDYIVDEGKRDRFWQSISTYWPGVQKERLIPAYVGIRPKLNSRYESSADFYIEGPKQHGINGLVCLCGIESPGLTSSLAIAEYVSRLI